MIIMTTELSGRTCRTICRLNQEKLFYLIQEYYECLARDFDMRTITGGEINFGHMGVMKMLSVPDFDMSNQKINWGASTNQGFTVSLELSWARRQILQSKSQKVKILKKAIHCLRSSFWRNDGKNLGTT